MTTIAFPTDDELKALLLAAEKKLPGWAQASELVESFEHFRRPYLLRALAWLCKLGLLEFMWAYILLPKYKKLALFPPASFLASLLDKKWCG